MRTLIGYVVLAVIGFVALKLIFVLVGVAVTLLMSVLWIAAIGFVFYLVLKVISPSTARRVRDSIKGSDRPKAA